MTETVVVERKKPTLPALFKKVADGIPITWSICYDYPTAYLHEKAGIDMILVGDSLAMTVLGYDSTLPVTMDEMLTFTKAVRRGAPNTFLIGDMPYMSYQPSVETAIRNAGRFMAEAGCDAIKLEGGIEMCDRVRAVVQSGIPVVGHLGLTPQSVSALGGFRVQGKGAEQAKRIVDAAKALERAGTFMIVLEMVPDRVTELVTERAENCIIMGIGSGPHAHGQVLNFYDMFSLFPKFKPKMVKTYGNAGELIVNGLKQYVQDVITHAFPTRENSFTIPDEEYAKLLKMIQQ